MHFKVLKIVQDAAALACRMSNVQSGNPNQSLSIVDPVIQLWLHIFLGT